MGLLFYIISIILATIFIPIGMIWGLIVGFYQRKFREGLALLNRKLCVMAISIDQYGNVVCAELFNSTLIKSGSKNKFGDEDETISSVLGKNKLDGSLTRTGKILDTILDVIEKDHSTKYIE